MIDIFSRKVFVVIGFAIMAMSATAQDVSVPNGPVILTISGAVNAANVDGVLQLDYESLSAFDATMIETSTIWTEGTHVFEGVSLHTLAEYLSVTDGMILATAINDYMVEIPVSDAVEGGPIVAYLMDGEKMSVREKGPLWVIYPYDSNSDYRSEVTYTRSIWQLDRLEIEQ
ncbi:MAG: hypothetical protein ACI9HB_001939 [Gammaproteobacteria bacterium]|jgi:hypothetical protein